MQEYWSGFLCPPAGDLHNPGIEPITPASPALHYRQGLYPLSHLGNPKGCIYFSKIFHAAAAKLLQSCPTLYDPRDSSPPGSPVPGILQARTLEWIVGIEEKKKE